MIGYKEAWVVSKILKKLYDGAELQYLISWENWKFVMRARIRGSQPTVLIPYPYWPLST
jgi:hypothetical protein